MMRTLGWWFGLVAVAVTAGCGDGGGAMLACTLGTGTSKSCFEISTNTSGNVAAAKMDCTNGGGVASDTCPRDGADGACRMTTTSGSVTISETFWYYSGNGATEMKSCVDAGNTWIAP
jgi:hypothetical protein